MFYVLLPVSYVLPPIFARMNFLKNIVGRLLAVWAILSFSISMLVFVIPVALTGLWPEPKRSRIAYVFFRMWMGAFFITSGVKRFGATRWFVNTNGKYSFR